jgi:UDP-3-O-[3-hydroxymyristoyl] glucosamine N-acyltransferase
VTAGPMRLGELAERLGGRSVEGDDSFLVRGVASLEDAGPGDLGFLRSAGNAAALSGSRVGALIAPTGVEVGGRPVIRSPAPNLDIARAARILVPEARPEPGIHPGAWIDAGAEVDEAASVGAGSVVGAGSRVGAGTIVHARVTLYPDVGIGRDCILHAGCVVREGSRLGDRVVLQPGAVIGGDGFGYEFDERGGLEKVPQLGSVVLEDDVEIGANTTIDRARFGVTRIGRGTKIDNLVMVAHNCDVGEGSALVAQVGIAGGTVLGRRVFMMAQSGAGSRARLGDGSFVGARGGVIRDLEPGTRVWGFPSMPERTWHRVVAGLGRLPELLRRVKRIERHLEGRE